MLLIGNILEEIREQLQDYFDSAASDPNSNRPDDVVLENISLVDAFNANNRNIDNKLVISLVSIEEEKTLRYSKTTTVIPGLGGNNSTILTHNPVVFLNLYLLFSSHNQDDYTASLNQLSTVINFFQRNHIFHPTNAPGLEKVVFELCTLSREETNHLWGVLGGKYIPSALYKVRLLPHEDINRTGGSGRILRERSNSNVL